MPRLGECIFAARVLREREAVARLLEGPRVSPETTAAQGAPEKETRTN